MSVAEVGIPIDLVQIWQVMNQMCSALEKMILSEDVENGLKQRNVNPYVRGMVAASSDRGDPLLRPNAVSSGTGLTTLRAVLQSTIFGNQRFFILAELARPYLTSKLPNPA